MCEKAVEIQGLRVVQVEHGKALPFIEGDYGWDGNGALLVSDDSRNIYQYDQYRPRFSVVLAGFCEGAGYETDILIWLPRQDQLQEILGDVMGLQPEFLAKYLYEFAVSKVTKLFDTMEQLWLAFVMKEKFNKTWNGENWEEGV